MTHPTPLSPWYVVFRFRSLGHLGSIEYYRPDNGEGNKTWTDKPREAQLFLTLQSATRTAKSVAGDIQLLWDKDSYAYFREE